MRGSLHTDVLPLDRHQPHTFLPTKQPWMMLLDRYCVSTWLSVLLSFNRPFHKKKTFQCCQTHNFMKLPQNSVLQLDQRWRDSTIVHASHVPSEAETVPIHASVTDGDVAVYLSWIAQWIPQHRSFQVRVRRTKSRINDTLWAVCKKNLWLCNVYE